MVQKINQKECYEFLKDTLFSCRTLFYQVTNSCYHHNCSYAKTPSIIKNGILSAFDQAKIEGKTISSELVKKYSDDNQVNGLSGISLASLEIDKSLMYEEEILYNPLKPNCVDILVSKQVTAYRDTNNYYNEFICNNRIDPSSFLGIDIRILKYALDKQFLKENRELIKEIINCYNYLIMIAQEVYKSQLDLPIRDMSNEKINLDIQKVAKLPSVKLI